MFLVEAENFKLPAMFSMKADVTVVGCFEVRLVWQIIINIFTPEQRLKIVQIDFENHESIRQTHCTLRTFYGAYNCQRD